MDNPNLQPQPENEYSATPLDPLRLRAFRLLESHGFTRPISFDYIHRAEEYNGLWIVGVNDEYDAAQIQSLLINNFSRFDQIMRYWIGRKIQVFAKTKEYQEYNPMDDPALNGGQESPAQEQGFAFHPNLIPLAQQLRQDLSEQGVVYLQDYKSIDPSHEHGGIEIGEIADEETAVKIQSFLLRHLGYPFSVRWGPDATYTERWKVGAYAKNSDRGMSEDDTPEMLDLPSGEAKDYLRRKPLREKLEFPEQIEDVIGLFYGSLRDSKLELGYFLTSFIPMPGVNDNLRDELNICAQICNLRRELWQNGFYLPPTRITFLDNKLAEGKSEKEKFSFAYSIGGHVVGGNLEWANREGLEHILDAMRDAIFEYQQPYTPGEKKES
ncbi:hypothetical protein HYU13_05920 [Candidatus Woesearchaeota archaeon]|nr:hypothetical protein [Candidatus Woesearchaeota archaeon]